MSDLAAASEVTSEEFSDVQILTNDTAEGPKELVQVPAPTSAASHPTLPRLQAQAQPKPQSHQPHIEQSPYPEGNPPAADGPAERKHWLVRAGLAVLHGMEFVGEVVASVLGVDEAKYQDIYDSLTEDELAEAHRVNNLRNHGRPHSVRACLALYIDLIDILFDTFIEYEEWLARQPAPTVEDPGVPLAHAQPGDDVSAQTSFTEMTASVALPVHTGAASVDIATTGVADSIIPPSPPADIDTSAV